MDANERKAFYEKLYFHEIEMRTKVEGRLQIPLSIFAVLFAFIGYLVKEGIFSDRYSISPVFWVCFWLSILAFIAAFFLFINACYGYTYRLLPTAKVLNDYYKETLKTYQEIDPGKARKWADTAFGDYALEALIDHATKNASNNDHKAEVTHWCISTLLVSVLLMAASFLPYYKSTHQLTEDQKNGNRAPSSTTASAAERCPGSASSHSEAEVVVEAKHRSIFL